MVTGVQGDSTLLTILPLGFEGIRTSIDRELEIERSSRCLQIIDSTEMACTIV